VAAEFVRKVRRLEGKAWQAVRRNPNLAADRICIANVEAVPISTALGRPETGMHELKVQAKRLDGCVLAIGFFHGHFRRPKKGGIAAHRRRA